MIAEEVADETKDATVTAKNHDEGRKMKADLAGAREVEAIVEAEVGLVGVFLAISVIEIYLPVAKETIIAVKDVEG